MLLEARADNNLQNSDGNTALICASEKGHVEIVQVLLEARAATDLTNKLDNTALVHARGTDHLEIARLLVEAGAAAGPHAAVHQGAKDQ